MGRSLVETALSSVSESLSLDQLEDQALSCLQPVLDWCCPVVMVVVLCVAFRLVNLNVGVRFSGTLFPSHDHMGGNG